jgi:diguanylate cyclase (GGDEF)-like protein
MELQENRSLFLEKFAGALLLLTILAIIWFRVGANTSLLIVPGKNWQAVFVSDLRNGGNSTGKLEYTDSSVILHYSIQQGYEYPYAAIELYPPGKESINLAVYDSIVIRSRFLDTPSQQVRLYLRNFNPVYSKTSNDNAGDASYAGVSLKYNEIQYNPAIQNYPARFHTLDLRVPSWWVSQMNVTHEQARVELNNIQFIEINTPPNVQPGDQGRFEIVSIEFRGKAVSSEAMYRLLLGIWLISVLGAIFLRMLYTSKILKQKDLKTKKLENDVQTDPLTGALNRRGIRQYLHNLQLNQEDQYSIIILDIDNFKLINDQIGHDAGDQVLQNLVQMIKENIRSTDAIGRWGGEEFLLLSPGCTLQKAIEKTESIRAHFAQKKLGATCSFGISQCSSPSPIAFEAAVKKADQALYRAKNNGKDRIEVSS